MENNQTQEKLLAEIERLKKELKKKKKYGLVWEEKPEDVVEMCKEKLPVLKEVKSKEIITDKTKPINLLIEGDNYHALSVLNYTHKGKIDVIYIDPPYNTGNKDFIFNDSFVDKEDSYRHSKWLTFMAKRLQLSKGLLSKDGVIFISIGEDEVAQLRLLCDLIFTENNFVTQIIWHNNVKGRQMDLHIKNTYESILVYAKDLKSVNINQEKDIIDVAGLDRDDISYYKKDYPLHNGTADFHINNRPNLAYSIYYNKDNGRALTVDEKVTTKDGFVIGEPTRNDLLKKGYQRIIPKYNFKYKNQRVWRWGQEKFLKEYQTELLFVDDADGPYFYQKKRFGDDGKYEKKFKNYINIDGGVGKNELLNILGIKKFDNPKPSLLIKYLIGIFSKENSIVLDFFAGSGTTGHAVLDLSKDDIGERKFILCTNNEDNSGRGLKIAEDICYPRIKKVIEGYKNIKGENIEGLGGNLKYFKTDFVDYKEVTDKNKIKLTKEAVEMLCVKEGTFESVLDNEDFKIFKNHDHYTGIIFDQLVIEDFKKAIKDITGKISVYIFSLGDDSFEDEFEDIKQKVKLSPIPEAILKVYRRIYK